MFNFRKLLASLLPLLIRIVAARFSSVLPGLLGWEDFGNKVS